MANKNSNFLKFIKLASLVKKVADKNPELKDRILSESTSKSKNSWNKIQKWTSANIFPEFKDKPISKVTLKNVENALTSSGATKKQSCFNVFKIPTSDLVDVEPFDLEITLMSFPPNLQVEVDLDGKITTGIQQIKNFSNIGNGELTKEVRELYPDLEQVRFVRLRKKGKKEGDRGNCSYYIKALFVNQDLTNDEEDREAVIGVSVGQLTKKQQEQRKQLKKALAERKKKKKQTKTKTRKFKTPSKVTSTKEDEKIESKIKKAKGTKEEIALLKQKEKNAIRFEKQRAILKQEFEDGIWTAKEFKKEVQDLKKKILLKGGEI